MAEIHAITRNLQHLSEELVRLRGEDKRDSQSKLDPSALPVASRRPSKDENKKITISYNLVQEDAKMIVGKQTDKQTVVVDQPVDDDASSETSEESYSGRSSDSHVSDISFVDPDEWDTDKWYQSIRVMFDKLQNKQEWDMMMALRKAFDGRSLERQQAFEKMSVLDEERNAEADHFLKAQQKFDKEIEDMQVTVFSSLSGFDKNLHQKSAQIQERKKQKQQQKKAGVVSFDGSAMKPERRHRVLWADQQEEKDVKEDQDDSHGKPDTLAGDLLRIISGQQTQIASLKSSSLMMQKKVAAHKAALRHIETTEKTGIDVEISEEVQNVLIDIMARVEPKEDGSKAKVDKEQEEDPLDVSEILASNGDTYAELQNDKRQTVANRELMKEIVMLKENVKQVQDSLSEFMTTRGQFTQAGIARRRRKLLERRRSSALGTAIANFANGEIQKPGVNPALAALFADLEKLPVAERFTKLQGKISQLTHYIVKAEGEKKIFEESLKNAEGWKKKLAEMQPARGEDTPELGSPKAGEVSPQVSNRRRMLLLEEKVNEGHAEVDKQEINRRRVELKKRRHTLLEANADKKATEEAINATKNEWQQLASNLNSALGEAPPKTIEEGKVVIELQDDEMLKLSTQLQHLKQKRTHQSAQAGLLQADAGIKSRRRQVNRGSFRGTNANEHSGEEQGSNQQNDDPDTSEQLPARRSSADNMNSSGEKVSNASGEKAPSRRRSRRSVDLRSERRPDEIGDDEVDDGEDHPQKHRKGRHRHRHKNENDEPSVTSGADAESDMPIGFNLREGLQEGGDISPKSIGNVSFATHTSEVSIPGGKRKAAQGRSKSIRKSLSATSVPASLFEEEAKQEAHDASESLNHLLDVQRENIEIQEQLRVYKDMLSEIQKKGYFAEENIKTLSDMHSHSAHDTEKDIQEQQDLKDMKSQVKKLQKMLKEKRQQWNEVGGEAAKASAATRNRLKERQFSRSQSSLLEEQKDAAKKAEVETPKSPGVGRASLTLEISSSTQKGGFGKRFRHAPSLQSGLGEEDGPLNVMVTPLRSLRAAAGKVMLQNQVKKTFEDVQLSLQGSSPTNRNKAALDYTPRSLKRQDSELLSNLTTKGIHTTSLLRAANVMKFANSLRTSVNSGASPDSGDLQVLGIFASPKASSKGDLDSAVSVAKTEPLPNGEEAPSPRRRSSLLSTRFADATTPRRVSNSSEVVAGSTSPRQLSKSATVPNLVLGEGWVDVRDKLDLEVTGKRAGSKERTRSPDYNLANPASPTMASPRRASELNQRRRSATMRLERSLTDIDDLPTSPLVVKGKRSGSKQNVVEQRGDEKSPPLDEQARRALVEDVVRLDRSPVDTDDPLIVKGKTSGGKQGIADLDDKTDRALFLAGEQVRQVSGESSV